MNLAVFALVLAVLFAALGAVDGRRRGVHPLHGAGSGLIAFAIGCGLIGLAVLIASPFLGVQP